MKTIFLVIVVLLCLICLPVISAELPVHHSVPVAEEKSLDLEISLEDAEICCENELGVSEQDLLLNVIVHNHSAHQKIDLIFPLEIVAKDEFNNAYQARRISSAVNEGLYGDQVVSLYPGEKVGYPCRMQSPVPIAKKLLFEISDKDMRYAQTVTLETRDIKNWRLFEAKEEFSADDLMIVYPRDKKIFAPGEKVFMKLDFSERAGRPDSIYILLSGYMLTDEEGKGQYELQIPPGLQEGDLEVIVMAEWGQPPYSQIVSKSLFLHIKG